MKGLILSGGHGVGLRPITYSQQKQLIPVANKSILFYVIEDLIRTGIDSIGIVVGPNKEQVMDTVNSMKWEAKIDFIYQEFPGGLAHAIKVSEDFLSSDKFIMYLGDNLLKGGICDFASEFADSEAAASLLLTTTAHPERYGIALIDKQKKTITRLVEKPEKPPSNLVVIGIYGLSPLIFEAIRNIKPSWRNELEIMDALQWLLNEGHLVKYDVVGGWWKDTGRSEDILDANRLILDDMKPENKGEIRDSEIKGKVNIGKNSVIEQNSTIKGPVIIGENCLISKAYIGPYTSIGNNCRLSNTEIEDSIVMESAKIVNIGRIVESLIGKDVNIQRNDNFPKGTKFVIGDSSEVMI